MRYNRNNLEYVFLTKQSVLTRNKKDGLQDGLSMYVPPAGNSVCLMILKNRSIFTTRKKMYSMITRMKTYSNYTTLRKRLKVYLAKRLRIIPNELSERETIGLKYNYENQICSRKQTASVPTTKLNWKHDRASLFTCYSPYCIKIIACYRKLYDRRT